MQQYAIQITIKTYDNGSKSDLPDKSVADIGI